MGNKKAWVVSVLMGLGHMRPAYNLRDIALDGVIIYGDRESTPPKEYKMWQRIQKAYYFLSKAREIPLIGKYIMASMLRIQKIEHYYPIKDLSQANLSVEYLDYLIARKDFCAPLIEKIKVADIPVINTFYATAIAIDKVGKNIRDNYLLICDTDFNRVWVPKKPRQTRIKYLVPCTQSKKRLLSYGVPEKNIFLTGFPLPKENIGTQKELEILREDLFKRLLRLDPTNKFFSFHQKSVFSFLGKNSIPDNREDCFTLTCAIGGSGAQVELIEIILRSLKDKIAAGKIRVNISAGIQKLVFAQILSYISTLGLGPYRDKGVAMIYDTDVRRQLDKFNQALRQTDVLWTKPSELSFYSALGIPILLGPSIGTHEDLNRRWLDEIHAGVEPTDSLEYIHEWLFDLRENGRLAEAAWDGFLKGRKLGTYKIEELIRTGKFTSGQTPLE
ncbi:MAG: hypothetical protein V1653_00090, partial [bacterium]